VLLQVGDWKITSPEDVLNASFYITAGKPVDIRVSRAGKEFTFTVTPADPPEGEELRVSPQEPSFLGSSGDLKLGK
jgi:S1-C subfamily serine protease